MGVSEILLGVISNSFLSNSSFSEDELPDLGHDLDELTSAKS